jgi:hypothetical protein
MAAMLNRAAQVATLNRARISSATILDKGGDAELCCEDLYGEDFSLAVLPLLVQSWTYTIKCRE